MKAILDKLQGEFDKYLETKGYNQKPDNLYAPINHIMSSGGKRIRALLTLLGHYGYADDCTSAHKLAYAVELFHNFTLVHDDIMDDAPLRRGKKTVHELYDTNTAILSGDVMQSYVIKELAEIDSPAILKIIHRFSLVAIQVCEGQSYDMIFESQDDVKISEYLDMIESKTAVLLGLALEAGALLAGASDIEAHHLFQFGKYAGITFQLQDDYLDLYGHSAKVGKQIGGDIIQKKKNYFYVKAIDLLEVDERDKFVQLYKSDINTSERVSKVMKIYNDQYLTNYVNEGKRAYMDLAFSHLEASSYNADKMFVIKQLTTELADRLS